MSATAIPVPTRYGPAPESASKSAVDSTYRKVTWRLIPFLFICYIVAFLDRINIGYAQLQMKQTLAFSDPVYGVWLFVPAKMLRK